MELKDLRDAIERIPGTKVHVLDGDLLLFLDEFGDGIRFHPATIEAVRAMWSPRGEAALEVYHADPTFDGALIITAGDVVFAPRLAELRVGATLINVDLPPLVAYTEMLEKCEQLALEVEGGHLRVPDDEEQIVARLLVARSLIEGAKRVGLAPALAVAWWRRSWDVAGEHLPDLWWATSWWWDQLVRLLPDTAELPSRRPEFVDHAAELRGLAVADFKALLPRFSVVSLDDELIEIWRSLLPVSPRILASTALDGLPHANVTMHLYEEGTGGFDFRHRDPEGWTALLQLSFSLSEATASIDEVRIPDGKGRGLFQRFLFNAEQVSQLLGITQMTVLATGVGAYAFASHGSYGNRRPRPDNTSAFANGDLPPQSEELGFTET